MTYSNKVSSLAPKAQSYEQKSHAPYLVCIREIVSSRCVNYNNQDHLSFTYYTSTFSGTGFAFERQGGYVYFLTNHHVVSPNYSPTVRKDVGLSSSCNVIGIHYEIVDHFMDQDPSDDIPLQLVRSNYQKDMAVLVAKENPQKPFTLIPYQWGSAKHIKIGSLLFRRGYAFGNQEVLLPGYVIQTPFIIKDQQDFQLHSLAFVTKQFGIPGMSGGPVLAINPRSGQYELVGITKGTWYEMNTKRAIHGMHIAIDEIRPLVKNLPPPPLHLWK